MCTLMYLDQVTRSKIVGVNKRTLSHILSVDHIIIITSHIKLDFDLKCVDNQTNMSYNIYVTKNVILGQELINNACVRDYYGHPADATLLSSEWS